jgi:hypothetical protein
MGLLRGRPIASAEKTDLVLWNEAYWREPLKRAGWTWLSPRQFMDCGLDSGAGFSHKPT